MPSRQRRPTHKECSKKLRQALEAVENGRRIPIPDGDRHFPSDMDEVGSQDAKEHWIKVYDFLEEIQSLGGLDCYAGRFPPLSVLPSWIRRRRTLRLRME